MKSIKKQWDLLFLMNSIGTKAAHQSALTGRPTITKSIQLVQAHKKEAGFLFYLPIYTTHQIPTNLENRNKYHFGWVYSPILASEVVQFVSSQNSALPDFIIEEISDSGESNELYNSLKNSKESHSNWSEKFDVYGQNWVIKGNLNSNKFYTYNYLWPIITFLLSFILTLLIYQQLVYFEKQNLIKNENLKIAEQKIISATEEINLKNSFLQKVINTLPAMISYWDKDGTNKLVNKQYSLYLGLTATEVKDQTFANLIDPTILSKINNYYMNVLTGETQEFEFSYVDFFGETRNVISKLIPDVLGNQFLGFTEILIDVTEIKSLEKANQESQALLYSKSKLSMLGEMAAGIAHEINNPLAIISGKTQILSLKISQLNINSEEKKYLIEKIETIINTTDRISSIVKGLRSFSRDSDNDPYIDTSLNKIFSYTLALVQEKIKKYSIEFNVVGLHENSLIECNETQISQILMNLISNSVDALQDLNEKWITLQVEDLNNQWKIQVTDSGLGIPEEIVEKIMQPFFTTKDVGHGTGLGLSISKGLAQKHHGTLEYQIIDGHTSFVLTLPKSQKNQDSKIKNVA